MRPTAQTVAWELLNEYVDDGTWSGGQDDELSECMARGLFPDGEFHVIREGNGVVFTPDTDVDEDRYKWFTVREIDVASENQAPAASAGPDQTVSDVDGNGVEPVTLDGSGSCILTERLHLSYGGMPRASVLGSTVTITLALSVGLHEVTLTVTDNDGATGTDKVVPVVQDWSSGDLEPEVWSESGNRRQRPQRLLLPAIPNDEQHPAGNGQHQRRRSGPVRQLEFRRRLALPRPTRELSAAETLTFESTSADVVDAVSAGKVNQLRVIVGSLNKDTASGTNDRVDIDFVEMEIGYQP